MTSVGYNPTGFTVNWDDPLTDGLGGLWIGYHGIFYDITGQCSPLYPINGTSSVTVRNNVINETHYSPRASNVIYSNKTPFSLNGAHARSIAAWYTAGYAVTPFQILVGCFALNRDDGGVPEDYIQMIPSDAGVDSNKMRAVSYEGINTIIGNAGSTATTGWEFVAMASAPGRTALYDYGGTATGTGSTGNWTPIQYMSIGGFCLWNYPTGRAGTTTQTWNGYYAMPMLWTREISYGEFSAMRNNPRRILVPKRTKRRRLFDMGAANTTGFGRFIAATQ
jgi:hypothetical protein